MSPDEDVLMIQYYIFNRWYHHTCAGICEVRMKQLSDPKAIWTCEFQGYETVLVTFFILINYSSIILLHAFCLMLCV